MLESVHYKSFYPEGNVTRDSGLKDESQILARISRLKIVLVEVLAEARSLIES